MSEHEIRAGGLLVRANGSTGSVGRVEDLSPGPSTSA